MLGTRKNSVLPIERLAVYYTITEKREERSAVLVVCSAA
jgi:hypothetical protein